MAPDKSFSGDGFSAPLILRSVVDGLKAYGLEAAAAGRAKPSSLQLTDWFWNEKATGVAIHLLREVLQAHEDERLQLIVSKFIVPGAAGTCRLRDRLQPDA